MKRSIKELLGYSVKARDGEKGKVKNILFDEESWTIRYLEVDLGSLFHEKRVLISTQHFKTPDAENQHFPIDLSTSEIERSPDLESDLPVSLEYEKRLREHYELQPYWPVNAASFAGRESMFSPDNPFRTPKKIIDEMAIDTRLRSFQEIKGYHILATDDRFGQVEDAIVDDSNWQIVYTVIRTVNLFPWSKQVMIPIELIEEISFINREMRIDLPKEVIAEAPEFDSSLPLDEPYESALFDYYGRKVNV